MRFSTWRRWVQSLPWSLRWFILLVLFRPALDVLYFLKSVSPFLSPLYIVGVLTPVLIAASYFARTFPAKRASPADWFFGLWGVLLFFNAFVVLINEVSLHTLEIAIKLITPVVVFFFVRHLVQSKRDLMGLVTTFLYSALVPFAMLLYENVVSPIGIQEGRGTLVRYHGGFADVMSYAIYVVGALLAACYFFMEERVDGSAVGRAMRLVVVGALCIMALLSIHHAASWIVFGAVLALFMLYSGTGKQIPALVFVLLIGVCGVYFIQDTLGERVAVVYQTDLDVLEGEKEPDRALHGRVGRWKRYLAEWNEMSPLAKAFGASLSGVASGNWLLGGIHSDYLRAVFASGMIGLLAYLGFYAFVFAASWTLPRSDRFLVQGAMAMVLLYSVTTMPTLYAPLMYLCLSIFAYVALAWSGGRQSTRSFPRRRYGKPVVLPRPIQRTGAVLQKVPSGREW